MDAIGRGTWIDKLAFEMLQREQALGRSLENITVESGLGASGVPHVGSLGDAVRSYGVKLALEDMGYGASLLAYSDDLDGLRKVPEGFPDYLKKYLGRPVSLIPDPFGCCDSYGSHMSGILLDGLDRLGIEYRFQRAYDAYRQGMLAENTHTILCRAEEVGRAIMDMVGQDKYTKSLPYFALCPNCQRLYTTKSYEYDASSRKILYRCGDTAMDSGVMEGCGHSGEADIRTDMGKLAWKVEFAARWSAFDVRFEAYGKDIMDSVQINDWVAENILGTPAPYHVKYEMFLDHGGKKISKSLGNVVTAQDWLSMASPQSLLLLLYKRIKGTRHLGLEDVPFLMNEYNELEDIYFGKTRMENRERLSKLRGLYEYANLLRPPPQAGVHVNYLLVVKLCRIFRQDTHYHVMKKLLEYGAIKDDSVSLDALIGMAGNYVKTHPDPVLLPVQTSPDMAMALRHLVATLRDLPETGPQDAIYQAAKSAGVRPRDFFVLLYQIILGASRGPRLGPLISDMGFDNVINILEKYTGEDGPQRP